MKKEISKIVFLTGAGMSVESGFKTFRGSMGCGRTILWSRLQRIMAGRETLSW